MRSPKSEGHRNHQRGDYADTGGTLPESCFGFVPSVGSPARYVFPVCRVFPRFRTVSKTERTVAAGPRISAGAMSTRRGYVELILLDQGRRANGGRSEFRQPRKRP